MTDPTSTDTVTEVRPSAAEAIAVAEAARDEGMDGAVHAADPRVTLTIDAAIAAANATGRRWSANDIRAQLPVSSQGLVGARVRAASMRRPREMYPVGRVPSTLSSTHAHEIKVWLGAEAFRAVNPSSFRNTPLEHP